MLKEIRKQKQDVKVIFISGHAEEAFEKNLDGNEEFAFLPKPFTLKQLAAKVKESLRT
jgi:two-component system, cell cycle sensor histidine kinase and response regulator CckA